ncbi:MAG TPA: lytic transglycosylase domain-containing protein [Thermoanaerobaculia bacterium]|nr:lytic transglycosylase domain-containing protein [Thermoanaerobaculia bacterium]
MKRTRIPFVFAAATLTFLVFPYDSPSDTVGMSLLPTPVDPSLNPDPGSWTGTRSLRSAIITQADLAAALRPASRQGFGLFAPAVPSEDEARRDFLGEFPYGRTILAASERHGVDGLLVAAVVEAESHFRPKRVSPRGAVGLMQILPSTAADFADEEQDLFDPRVNLEIGTRYLGTLIDLYDGDLKLALAAYNAGPGAVARYDGVPPYRETQGYVRKVMALYARHQQSLGEEAPAAGVHEAAGAARASWRKQAIRDARAAR